jgi:hypothetical protein
MTDSSRLDRDSEETGVKSRTPEPKPAAVSEYADQYNHNDIGLAMRRWQSAAE